MKDFLSYMEMLGVFSDGRETQVGSQLLSLQPVPRQCVIDNSHPNQILDYVDSCELLRHPFLVDFFNASLSDTALHSWLKQRYLISWCFPNWLTAVISRLASVNARIPMITNLYDEHGLGEESHKPHPQMWQQLFEELEIVAPGSCLPLPSSPIELSEGTKLYLQYYTEACFRSNASIGLGLICFTESILPHENYLVLEGLRRQGISERGQEFFEAHCHWDHKHSEEIINVIIQTYNEPETIQKVWDGVKIGVLARKAFYDSLYSEAI
jgi:pyrroloquinoline-quinone synthase